MTTISLPRRTVPSVGSALAVIHEGWMRQVVTFLGPALNEDADFWSRWAGARFLTDQFGDRFRVECAFVDALGRLLAPETVRCLAAARQAVERTGREMVAAGRRRDTRLPAAHLAHRFIDQLALWCVEVELATARIPTTALPAPAHRLLDRLWVADALSR